MAQAFEALGPHPDTAFPSLSKTSISLGNFVTTIRTFTLPKTEDEEENYWKRDLE